jgi:PAS domain S-box-containing protein
MAAINFNAPITVLLVEDDTESGQSVKRMLERRGAATTLVNDAEAALREFHANQFDAIVADIILPGRSGVDLLRDIRSENPDFPFILLTGFDSLSTALQAVRFGAHDYLLKPLDSIDVLFEPLRKAIREYRMILRNQELERNLRRSEARFRAVIENTQDIAYHFNFKTETLEYLNPSVERVLGISEREVRDLTMMKAVDLLHPDDQARVLDVLLGLVDTRIAGVPDAGMNPAPIEFRVRHADGSYRWLSVAQTVVFDEVKHDPVALVGIARDVTAQKNADARESQLLARTERVSRLEALSALAGGVAHDLNNSLSAMLIMPGLVMEELEKRGILKQVPTVREDLTGMIHFAERAGEVVQDLLALSRRRSQKFATVSLNALVTSTFGSVEWRNRLQAHGAKVTLDTHLDLALKEIQGSAAHLQRVLSNLSVNALEAMPSGGRLMVETRNETVAEERMGYEVIRPGEYSVLQMRDTGVGIGKSQMERLFEPFNSSKMMGSISGTGLGLAIVHGVLKDHRGYIDVISRENEGTTFVLYFPVSVAPEVEKPEEVVDLAGRGRILLVEDRKDLLAIMMRVLIGFGYEVVGVTTPRDAIAAFSESHDGVEKGTGRPFDLLILDMIMDGGDGLDVYREVVARHPGQKCLIVSGYSETGRIKEAMALGAAAFLRKPFTVGGLGRAVRDILSGRVSGVTSGRGKEPKTGERKEEQKQ